MNRAQKGLGLGSVLVFLAVVALCLLLVPSCLEKSAKEKASVPPLPASQVSKVEPTAPGDRSGLLDRQLDAEEARQKADEQAHLQEAEQARAREPVAAVETPPAEQALQRARDRDADEAARAVAQVNQILARWGEAKARAGAPTKAMDEVTRQDLQSIERAAQTLVLPECARQAQAELVDGMDQYIQGMLASGTNGELVDIKAMLAETSQQMTQQASADLTACGSAASVPGKKGSGDQSRS